MRDTVFNEIRGAPTELYKRLRSQVRSQESVNWLALNNISSDDAQTCFHSACTASLCTFRRAPLVRWSRTTSILSSATCWRILSYALAARLGSGESPWAARRCCGRRQGKRQVWAGVLYREYLPPPLLRSGLFLYCK